MQRILASAKKSGFITKLALGEISDDDACLAAKKLVESYPEDFEPELETELVHFNAFLKGLRKGEDLSDDKINEYDMLLLIVDNYVHVLFGNALITLKLYLCMFVTNRKGERLFSKLKLILTYLENSIGQKRLASLAVLSIESQLLRGIDFSSLIDIFAEDTSKIQVLLNLAMNLS